VGKKDSDYQGIQGASCVEHTSLVFAEKNPRGGDIDELGKKPIVDGLLNL